MALELTSGVRMLLAAVAATASERGLDNVLTQQGAAEQLPFEAGTFDFLATRYSAHHWRSFEAGLREARRVLKPGSCTVFVDSYAPGQPLFDTHLQAIELLRDTSHCRDYSAAEWLAGLGRAGFALIGGIVPPMGRIKRARSDLARRRPTRA